MKHLSLEETIKLCLYHEVSHSFHYTNIKNKQISWEDGISNFLDIGKDLINKSLWYPNKKPGERFDEKIISGSKEKLSILEFIGDCVILDKEIYADVGSLLLLRNEKINKGDYSSNDMHKYIDAVLLARCEEAHLANFFNDFSKGITDFNHNTVCGLEHLKTMINTLPDKILSPKEINTISDTCSKVGLSRVILVSHLIKENYLDQFKLLLNIKYNEKDKKFFLDYDSNSIKAESLWNNIKHTTGIDWYEKFLDKVSACKNMMTSLESKTIWYAGTNPLGYQSDIEFHNTMVAEIDKKNLVHVNIKDVKANLEKLYYEECEKYHNKKDKALKKKSANNSIQKLRNKFISNSDKTPKLNNT
jgi:hypothetical protein